MGDRKNKWLLKNKGWKNGDNVWEVISVRRHHGPLCGVCHRTLKPTTLFLSFSRAQVKYISISCVTCTGDTAIRNKYLHFKSSFIEKNLAFPYKNSMAFLYFFNEELALLCRKTSLWAARTNLSKGSQNCRALLYSGVDGSHRWGFFFNLHKI